MPSHLARSQVSSVTAPALDVFTGTPGAVADAYALEFLITVVATGAQVYPVSAGTYATVDLTADKIGTGHYAAAWTVGAAEATGRHRITWRWKQTVTDSWHTITEDFDVVETSANAGDGYCLISDLRDEGITTTQATDTRVMSRIRTASQMIERYCGRHFEPRAYSMSVDGRGQQALLLDQPVISVFGITFDTYWEGVPLDMDLADFRIYNRHLTDQLLSPDDRNAPKLELIRFSTWLDLYPGGNSLTYRWPSGTKNITVAGVFGYTERDGDSAAGRTPELLRHACKLMVIRELPLMNDPDERDDRRRRNDIASMRSPGSWPWRGTLVRFSIGLEEAAVLQDDLTQALAAIA